MGLCGNIALTVSIKWRMQTRYKMHTDTKTISVKYMINFQYFKPMLVSRNRLPRE